MASDSFVGEALVKSPFFEKCDEVLKLQNDIESMKGIINGANTLLRYAQENKDWSYVENAQLALEKINSQQIIDYLSGTISAFNS